jgi:hypothetical protein
MTDTGEMITIIMNQTNYDKDLATKKLEEWDNNYINVIKEYLNPNFQQKKPEKKISNNQKIITSIRKFMDKASINYERKKRAAEMLKRKQELEEQQRLESINEKSEDGISIEETKN